MVTVARSLVREEAHRTRPSASLRQLTPNWYAAVMGTAMLGTAGAGLPVRVPGLRTVCVVLWALSLLTLVTLLVARAARRRAHGDRARADLLDPAVSPFFGCLSMALLAVGAGSLRVGGDWIGERPAVVMDTVLFCAGTAVGLVAAVGVPYLMMSRREPLPGTASPVWLLPLVCPMVSAALGPQLLPYLPHGQAQRTLLYACVAMFGMSLLAVLAVLPVIMSRLLTGGPLPVALTPALFLVLGPLGQSVTAVGQFAGVADGVVPAPYVHGFEVFAVLYGVPVTGFALLWLALSLACVVRALRAGLRFGMTWWAFTFPVGTCVTGATGLAARTGLPAYQWLAVGLYVLLAAAWLAAAGGTAGGLVRGTLLAPPPAGEAVAPPVSGPVPTPAS
ncbi:TDT family transporter [Streptomyces tsukubensis]|uniref:TDT family transporter n=1 Tax=Streptomyces tsukubensis TaxID=83656 RepID=UPI00098FA992|nr:TDT family transporter [Streptomyces tsukubensis]QFR92725.1 C4-dicarboxylate ABC transporter [Streptomyces tsukubensis]